MRNTGIVYSSAERSPVVLPEFAGLLPPLSEEQLAILEADILRNGCYSPIIVNERLEIVDGHNRQTLCEKNGIPYRMAVFAFDDTLEAMRWALDTQKSRRNLDTWELGRIALRLKPEVEAKARANQSAAGGDKSDGALLTTLSEALPQVSTRKELADTVGIGEVTMGKVMRIDENAPDVVKEALDRKEISVNQGYNITREVQDLPEEKRENAARSALERERGRKTIRKADAEISRRGKIARRFWKTFEVAVQLDPTEENIDCWAENMDPRVMAESIREARMLSETFATIAENLGKRFPEDCDPEEYLAGFVNNGDSSDSGGKAGQEADGNG